MSVVKFNRAPVLTLWGVVVAQAQGHSRAPAALAAFGLYEKFHPARKVGGRPGKWIWG